MKNLKIALSAIAIALVAGLASCGGTPAPVAGTGNTTPPVVTNPQPAVRFNVDIPAKEALSVMPDTVRVMANGAPLGDSANQAVKGECLGIAIQAGLVDIVYLEQFGKSVVATIKDGQGGRIRCNNVETVFPKLVKGKLAN